MSDKKKTVIYDDDWKKKGKRIISSIFVLSAFVMLILVVALLMAIGIVWLIRYLRAEAFEFNLVSTIVMLVGISAVMGYGFTMLLGSTMLVKPIDMLVSAMDDVAEGKFDTRLDFKGTVFNNETFRGIASGFNSMAEELGSTEVLRSDFVNNFSHEFKTPIVSIAGFCDLLRSEELTEEERDHYLDIIGRESRRLSALATNILSLTKIENQSILSDVSEFNLSEQIRSAVLLLESKWATRGIVPELDFDEITIRASEQLLKEVWLNLIDNAIKFSPDCGMLGIKAVATANRVTVSITNAGPDIPEGARERIFNKFYQVDESHSSAGSGVGLAVVKKVVELHRGSIDVKSEGGLTTFTIGLPRRATK